MTDNTENNANETPSGEPQPISSSESSASTEQILENAKQTVEDLKARGWTRETFAAALGEFLGVARGPVSELAPLWFRDEWAAGKSPEVTVVQSDSASRGVVVEADERWITIRYHEDDLYRHMYGSDLSSYRWTEVTSLLRFDKRPESATNQRTVQVQVQDAYADDAQKFKIQTNFESGGVSLTFPDYGVKTMQPGHGPLVFAEYRHGVPYLAVWDDINQEEPSHIISLERAAEKFRDQPSPTQAPKQKSVDASKDSFGERVDLSLTARRLRMKADGARWACERRRLLAGSAEYAIAIEPNDGDIIRRAKAIPGCYLWTNGPNCPSPPDPAIFLTLAACYDNCAAAAELVIRLDVADPPATQSAMQKAFRLLAEAQSALRVAATQAGGPEDSDQFEVFQWLKLHTRTREIYVERHMRVNDPGDPQDHQALAKRIEDFAE